MKLLSVILFVQVLSVHRLVISLRDYKQCYDSIKLSEVDGIIDQELLQLMEIMIILLLLYTVAHPNKGVLSFPRLYGHCIQQFLARQFRQLLDFSGFLNNKFSKADSLIF